MDKFEKYFEKEWIKWLDFIVLAIVALAGITISLIGIWYDNINAYYPHLCYVLLTAISLHLCLSFSSQQKFRKSEFEIELKKLGNEIISSVGGVEKRIFTTAEEADNYIAEKISLAESRIYDFNWQDNLSAHSDVERDEEERQRSQAKINESIKVFCSEKQSGSNKKKDKKPLVYKEIFTFSYENRVKTMKEHIEFGDKYLCAYYDNIEKDKFPKLQFVIIDEKEVIFVSSRYRPNLCAISDERIVSIFNLYFNDAWELSEKIKDKTTKEAEMKQKIKEIEGKYTEI